MSPVLKKMSSAFLVLVALFWARSPQPIVLSKNAKGEAKVPELCPEKGRKPFIANGKPFRSKMGHLIHVPLRHRCRKP